jgi:hypothetical protein
MAESTTALEEPDPSTSTVRSHFLTPNVTQRLSMPIELRLTLFTLFSGVTGLCLGLAHGSTETGLRFRAENAHRLPDTQTGWYLYHKSKNYHVILGGLKEGIKMAGRIGFWTGIFVVMEEGLDMGRFGAVRAWKEHAPKYAMMEEDETSGNIPRDFLSTTSAGLGTAGLFSAWNGFPLPTTVRLMKMGAKVGLGFGLLQDALSLMRGRRLGYVEFVKKHALGRGEDVTRHDKAATPG